jgi:hypothetical protein
MLLVKDKENFNQNDKIYNNILNKGKFKIDFKDYNFIQKESIIDPSKINDPALL